MRFKEVLMGLGIASLMLSIASLMACSGTAFQSSSSKPDDAKDKDIKVEEEGEGDDKVDEPQIVAGAFLTCEPVTGAEDDQSIDVGCNLEDDAGTVDLSGIDASWVVTDASDEPAPVEVQTNEAYAFAFTALKEAVNAYTVQLTLAKGDLSQVESITLDGIEAGEKTSEPYPLQLKIVAQRDGGFSFFDETGSITFDWSTGLFSVTGPGAARVLFELELSDGETKSGQFYVLGGVLQPNSDSLQMVGDWSVIGGVEEPVTFNKVGRAANTPVLDATPTPLNVTIGETSLTHSFADPASGSVLFDVAIKFKK